MFIAQHRSVHSVRRFSSRRHSTNNLARRRQVTNLEPRLLMAVTFSIPDPNLDIAIHSELQIDQATPLTESDMQNLTYLNLSQNTSITDLAGLEFATNLVNLYANGTSITSLAPLTGLHLEMLFAQDNSGITDLSPLAGMTTLQGLNVHNTGVSSIASLTGLSSLTNLDIGNTLVTDISVLTTLTALTQLNLDHAPITDLSSIPGLSNLRGISLEYTHPTTLTPLFSIPLTSLDIQGVGIGQTAFASYNWSALHLTRLYIGENNLTDLTPLAGQTSMYELNFANNEVATIAPLSTMTSLTNLEARYNPFGDLSPLSGLSSLRAAYLYDDGITDLSPLAGLTGMQHLYVGENSITTLAPLQGMHDLSVLYANNNHITTIANVDWSLLPIDWGNINSNNLEVWPEGKDYAAGTVIKGKSTDFVFYSQYLTFADPAFELAIRNILLKNNVSQFPYILSNEMTMTSLDLSGQPITSIAGIENCQQLTTLDLRNTALNLNAGLPERKRVDLLINRGVNVLFDQPAGPAPLLISGTVGPDSISLRISGTNLVARINGVRNDFPLAGISSITVNGLAGDDVVSVATGISSVTIVGGDGNDTITGGDGDDFIDGGTGNDLLYGGDGNDTFAGGPGNDILYGDLGDDQLHGGRDDDRLYGGKGDDLLWGDKGSNYLDGGQKDDVIYARNSQRDSVIGGAGTDQAQIDDGTDVLLFEDVETLL